MKRERLFTAGIAAILVVFGLVLAGCNSDIDFSQPSLLYNVTFKANTGMFEDGLDTKILKVGSGTNIAPPVPTKTGTTDAQFWGWFAIQGSNATPDGWGDMFDDTTPVTDDITLYARWMQNSPKQLYTVSFDPDGGTVSPSQRRVYLDEAILGELPEPVKNGSSFGGWYTNRDGGGKLFWNETTITNDIRVYAKWGTARGEKKLKITGIDRSLSPNFSVILKDGDEYGYGTLVAGGRVDTSVASDGSITITLYKPAQSGLSMTNKPWTGFGNFYVEFWWGDSDWRFDDADMAVGTIGTYMDPDTGTNIDFMDGSRTKFEEETTIIGWDKFTIPPRREHFYISKTAGTLTINNIPAEFDSYYVSVEAVSNTLDAGKKLFGKDFYFQNPEVVQIRNNEVTLPIFLRSERAPNIVFLDSYTGSDTVGLTVTFYALPSARPISSSPDEPLSKTYLFSSVPFVNGELTQDGSAMSSLGDPKDW